jgi:hypothetical protein
MPPAQALRALGPGFVSGNPEGHAYARVLDALRTRTRATLSELPADDFDVLWPLGIALRCALKDASIEQATGMWDAFEGVLHDEPRSAHAGLIAGALRARPAPAGQMRRLIERLAAHPSCAVRTAALALDGSADAAQAALRSSCWQLQARALRILEQEGVAPREPGAAPPFLRNAPKRAVRRAP